MKYAVISLLLFTLLAGAACTRSSSEVAANTEKAAAETPKPPQDGFYTANGMVTKINEELGSIELDHEAIPDLMPAMKMEFKLKDKKMIKNVAVGDKAKFTIEYKQGTEIIIAIAKSE